MNCPINSDCDRVIFSFYSVQMCEFLESFFVPPSISIILFMDNSLNFRFPSIKSVSSIPPPSATNFFFKLSDNVFSFQCDDSVSLEYCFLISVYSFHSQIKSNISFHINSLLIKDCTLFLDTLNRGCLFFDDFHIYSQFTTQLDFKIIRQLNTNFTISDALRIMEWPKLSFYLNHMMKYAIVSVSGNNISCIENSYRSFIFKFVAPKNLKSTKIPNDKLNNTGKSLCEFCKNDYEDEPFEFKRKSVVIYNNSLHAYDLKAGLSRFVSTFTTKDISLDVFFDDVRQFYLHFLRIGYKMFHYYTRQEDWRYSEPNSLAHDPFKYKKALNLLKSDLEDNLDYVEYVTRYCRAKYKQSVQLYSEYSMTGYSGFISLGGLWQVESNRMYSNEIDLNYDLCKQACKNREYNIIEYVDTMDKVKANPNRYKKQKTTDLDHWKFKGDKKAISTLVKVQKEAISQTLETIESKKSFWHTKMFTHFQTNQFTAPREPELVFKKPVNENRNSSSAKRNAEMALYNKILDIPIILIDLSCKHALQRKLTVTLEKKDMYNLSKLSPTEQYWYKKLLLFNLQYEIDARVNRTFS
eukprot:NODE_461_length_8173_cov_0.353604.p1 type:complete len:580 gc:universal NODE_461_length_8173_cov_0.353604:158-1897(+)